MVSLVSLELQTSGLWFYEFTGLQQTYPQTPPTASALYHHHNVTATLEDGLSANSLARQASFLVCGVQHEMKMQPLAGRWL